MKNSEKKRSLWKLTICVLVICGIVGTVISGILFKKNPAKTSAYASMEFSFEGAASGIAPNGYAFDLSKVTSDEVLEAALKDAGMTDKYTVAQIREQMEVQGVYPEDIVEQMTSYESVLDFSANRTVMASTFHPTLYSIVLYNNFDKSISKDDLQKLLGCILSAYKDYFTRTYAAGSNDIEMQATLKDYDYPQQLTILTHQIEESVTYAEEMYEKKPGLMIGGKGFNSIAVELTNLIDTDISKLSANITINALTKNPDRLIIQYNYEIRSLNNQLDKKNAQLERMDALIKSYDKNEIIYLSTTDSLTKIDGNSSETYDKLVTARKEVADEITTLKSNIATYQLRLKNLTGEPEEEQPKEEDKKDTPATDVTEGSGEGDEETTVPQQSQEEIDALAKAAAEAKAAQTAALEADIDVLLAKRESIMKDFQALIKLYNDQQINDLTVNVSDVKYSTPKLLSGAFIKQTLKVAGPIVLAGFIVCAVLFIIRNRKEEKAK